MSEYKLVAAGPMDLARLRETLARGPISLDDGQLDRFCRYYQLLLTYNAHTNLTAITDPVEVAQKHFLDSLLPASLLEQGARCVDVGTGAGFPGLPLLILRPDLKMTLLDALNKRVAFLEEVLKELDLRARCIHGRAEDAARDDGLRGKFDYAFCRALAHASTALEWTVPFLRLGGEALLYKGPKAEAELAEAEHALQELGAAGTLLRFPADWGDRYVLRARKLERTKKQYPRRAGAAQKKTL